MTRLGHCANCHVSQVPTDRTTVSVKVLHRRLGQCQACGHAEEEATWHWFCSPKCFLEWASGQTVGGLERT